MPGFTQYFGLAFFDVGDNLSDLSNVELEMDRFVIIDSQLYGLYSVFGSGVISGWTVTAPTTQNANNITVDISSGTGIINMIAAETLYQQNISNLPPNQGVYIFAQLTGLTTLTRAVNFYFSTTTSNDATQILLAFVQTGDSGVASIDNTVRTQIGFQSIINQAIAAHKHRGSPTKIDLAEETRGQLPGSKIGNIPAELITEGVLAQPRIGPIDHNILSNRGIFTHDELDTMARKLSGNVDQLMGEIDMINRLKNMMFMKTKFSDYDQDWVNAFCLIPGITSSDLIEMGEDTTDCNVNTSSPGCISGVPVVSTQNLNITWTTDASFSQAYSTTNVVISDGVSIARTTSDILMIDSFESLTDGQTDSSFVAALTSATTNTKVIGDSTVQTEGLKSGQFNVDQASRVSFTKTFSTPQDWSSYDVLNLSIRCIEVSHAAVYFYFVDAVGNVSSSFVVLSSNEVTSNIDPNLDDFEDRAFSIGSINRQAIKQIVFFSDDITQDITFWVDDIHLSKSAVFQAQGSLRMRYSTSQEVVFTSVTYTNDTLPSGTSIKTRLRAADTTADLNNAIFTPFIQPGTGLAIRGKIAEIEVVLLADPTQNYSPNLTSLTLSMNVNSEDNGFTIQSPSDWAAGSSSNLHFTGTANPENVTIQTPATVGDMSFLTNGLVNEVDSSFTPVFSITGANLPVSVNQAFAAVTGALKAGLSNAVSAVRTSDRRWIVCDTDNDRVLFFDSGGNLLHAYCGYDQDADVETDQSIPLTADYNPTTGMLWLTFSQTIVLTEAAFSKIQINIGQQFFFLSDEGANIASGGNLSGRVFGIPLTSEHQSRLKNLSIVVTVTYSADLTTGFDNLFASIPITIYMNPISFHEYFFKPVYAVETLDGTGRFWLCNATILKATTDSVTGQTVNPRVPSPNRPLYLFDPNQTDSGIFQTSVYFSDVFGGFVLEQSDGTLMAAGLDANKNGRVYSNALSPIPQVLYGSPVNAQPTCISVDSSGYYWITESSGTARAGRIIQIDSFGNVLTNISGAYTNVNCIQVLANGNLLVST